MTSAELIKAMRSEGHRVNEIASMLGVSPEHVCNVQRGAKELSDAHLRDLAHRLDLDAEQILFHRMQKRGVLSFTAEGRSPEQLREIIRLVAA